ncbi:hypothetical protein FFJ24_001445 [Pedobacter sp. KBS0701]|uniref:hypothetical protein n=1 Tax=Pedobacter sp. KBS0701 TaxID=2578106 RepID=UPI00110DF2BF|nr:hypothetical protein [Pedobacter sp. KBS0701]QDW23561.1 hypothetical protein FFJ24_001445 [Pedobacter sp. KBS0701]
MKRILFLLFILINVSACKKDTDNTTSESLSGKWSTGGYDLELYNSSGIKVSHIIADAVKSYWTFDDKQVKVSTDINTSVKFSDYILRRNADNRILTFSNPNFAVQTTWSIVAQTDQYMRISSEVTDKQSLIYGTNQTAARGVMNIYLTKE